MNYGQNAAAALQNIQQLNTFTEVNIVTKGVAELDEEFLQSFSVILLSDCDEVRIKSYPSRSAAKRACSKSQFSP
jgi:hypothetical protein